MASTVDAGLTDPSIWVPVAEAARLQNPPVSRAAMHKRVTRLVEAGRLSTKAGPRNTVLVNIVALNRVIVAETDPAQALRNGRLPLETEADEDAPEEDAPTASKGGASYHTSRAAREAYQAEHARLDLQDRLGKLADKDDVEQRTMTVMRKIRDRLLALPATVADRVASAPDARTVRTILSAEMRVVLEALAGELDKMDDEDGDELDDTAHHGQPEAVAA
jgi:hypothetical protein